MQIRRVSGLDSRAFDEFVRAGEPVLIPDDPGLLRITGIWTLDYLAEKHPGHELIVEHSTFGGKWNWKPSKIPFAQYVQYMRSNLGGHPKYSLAVTPLAQTFPNTAAEVEPPRVIAGRKISHVTAFMGVNTLTGAHYHTMPLESLLAQTHGRKEVVLYSPDQFELLKPFPWYSDLANWSQLSIAGQGDIPTSATGFRCIVESGEMLYIPQGWFHIVRGFEEVVTLTYFFRGSWFHSRPRIALRDISSQIEKNVRLTARKLRARFKASKVAREQH